ncbi:MAG: hypothetical protein K2W96_13950 [Gemmataceae bacterium]|nr:hypothetical protein [Gemmataceae bacterium]
MSRWLLLALLLIPSVQAQEAGFREELRFAEALRARGDTDLALEHLKSLEKGASPELRKELPLEFAKTRLRLASDEPDPAKRLALYRDAQNDFSAFIAANPGHPRVGEAGLDIARVLNAAGKAELSQALLNPDPAEKKALSDKARATLVQAQARLKEAEKALGELRDALPKPDGIEDAAKKKAAERAIARAEADIQNTVFERAMNLFDQSETYLGGSNETAASKLVYESMDLLSKLAAGPATSPATWKAKAWQGRIIFQTETAEKARAKFSEVIDSTQPSAAEGRRLALYFRMLAIRDKPQPEDSKWAARGGYPGGTTGRLMFNGENWRRNYSRHLRTPEGFGTTYLLAQVYLGEAGSEKKISADKRNEYRARARQLLRELETTENEYSDRARRMKLGAMVDSGIFKKRIDDLRTWEDFYIRSQYEAFRMGANLLEEAEKAVKELPDLTKITDPKEKKKAEGEDKKARAELKRIQGLKAEDYAKIREGHIAAIRTCLRKALALPPAARPKGSAEPSTAKAVLAYWATQEGMRKGFAKAGAGDADLEEAARIGEELIRDDPRSPQASATAVYVLQAVGALLDGKRAARDEEGIAAGRERLNSLAAYVEDRWPTEAAGDMARYGLGLQLMREENYGEAIKKLETVSPGYGNYALVCFQIADAADKAMKDAEARPIPGDRPGDYKKRALLALERIPLAGLGTDPTANRFTVAGKARLGRMLFGYERYGQMKAIADELLPRLDKLPLGESDEQDKAFRNQLRNELTDLTLYAAFGIGATAAKAGDHQGAASALDPLVDALASKDDSPAKSRLLENKPLAMPIMTNALRSNMHLGKVERTDKVLAALDALNEGGGGTSVLEMLASLIRFQVEEVRKKGDAAALEKAKKDYTDLLDRRTKGLARTPELVRALAGCYSSMGKHAEAARELAPMATKAGDPADAAWLALRLTYIRELRLSKEPALMKEARKLIDAAMKTELHPRTKKPWGQNNLTAIKENGYLLQDEGKYGEAFALWEKILPQLAPHLKRGAGPMRDAFFEVYFNMTYCMLKFGMAKPEKAKRDEAVERTARQIIKLQENHADFGGGESEKRFLDLLAQEAALKAKYDELKKAKAPKK